MGKFKVGQWVRALVDWGSIEKGKLYQIPHLDDDGEPWFTPDGSGGWTDYLSLDEIEPWTPHVGERVRVVYSESWNGEGFVYRNDGSIIGVAMKTGANSGANGGFRISEIEPVAKEAQAKLQIEAGKFYKTRDGRKVGPMEQSWGAWRDADRRITSQSWFTDGTFIQGHVSQLDLISEWVEPASNDNAPVAKQPEAKPPKFKVGDVVTPSHGLSKDTATVTKADSDQDIHVRWNDGAYGSVYGWKARELQLVTGPAKPTPTAIVALIENGQPKPAVRPHVHANPEAAKKEADRLASKFKGKQFGVYVLSSTSEQAKPVYDHKWQRLAADGLKIDAIKELRGITGMGLKPAKEAVEYFLEAS